MEEITKRIVSQGSIYLCDLNPVVGSEQGGIRPVLVVSNPLCCAYSPTVQVIPITGKVKSDLPTHYILTNKDCRFLDKEVNTFLCESIRTIDKARLRNYIGFLDKCQMKKIYDCIMKNFFMC